MGKRTFFQFSSIVFIIIGGAFGFNHPEIKWRSVVTDHFIIHYYDRTEPAVYAAWKIAEQTYASLSGFYDIESRGKINLSLADYDDYSNGFANWTNESVMIWITDGAFDLRGNNTWLNNVITHELAHIITLKKQSNLQLLDWTIGLQYASPGASVSVAEPYATNMFWPAWFAEGIAQRESERAGNDGWDSRRDMLLRDAVLFSRPLRLAEMGHFNHNSLGDELVYNQGFSFVTFLENRLGREKMRELLNDGRRTTFFAQYFNDYFREHTGLTIEKLYDEWIDSVKIAGQRMVPQSQTPATVIWNRGFLNAMPKLSSDHSRIGWLSNDRDDYSRTDLLIAPSGEPEKYQRIPWAKQSWDFSPDGRKAYYIKSRTPNERGSFFNDLFVRDLVSGGEKRLTQNARVYDVAVAPDNRCLAWIRYRDGAFSIVKSTLEGRSVTTVLDGSLGEPLRYLSFNPNDAGLLATTRVKNGKSHVCVVDLERKTITPLTAGQAQEESPFWAPDDRIYYSADYDGINNIYSVNPDGSDCMRHTSTSGGLFSPYVIDDSTFVGSEYRAKGFRIVTGSLLQDSSFDVPDTASLSFKPLPKPRGKVTIRSNPYEPRLLRRVWELQTSVNVSDPYGKIADIGSGEASENLADSLSYTASVTLMASRSDAIEKKNSWMGLQIAIQSQGVSRDSVIDASCGHVRTLAPDFSVETPLRIPSRTNRQAFERKRFMRTNALMSTIESFERYKNGISGTRSASGDSAGKPTTLPLIIPGMGWQSNVHTLSLGLSVQGILVNAIIPSIIAANGQAQWHILRDVYADFSPQLQFYPITLIVGQFISMTALPLSLIWNQSGYANTDIAYNGRDVTQFQCTLMPSFFPLGRSIETSDGRDSTVYHNGSSSTCEISCGRGFPVMRYSSLVVGAMASGTWYSEPIQDPQDTLCGASDAYTTAGLSAQYRFPIARQINRGRRYADALYGSILYKTQLYSNAAVTDRALGDALSRPSFDARHFFVEHGIGAAITFGCTKSYAFSQMHSLSVLWSIWAKRLQVNVSAGL